MQNTFPVDGRGVPVQKGTGMVFADAGANISPLGADTAPVALVWPANAIALYVCAREADVALSDDGESARFSLPQGAVFEIPGQAGGTTYILRGVATSLQFLFEVLN